MRYALFMIMLLAVGTGHAQPFAIGNTVQTFFDGVRNRDVECEIHYPALVAGDDEPMAAGLFPVIVIGHGFVMGVDAYAYFWQHLAPLGYIVALPTTEGGFAPDHAEFGADLAFIAAHMSVESADPVSLFFGHVAPERALAGHSMGGGAAFLGAAGNADIDAMIVLAPAETTPSAIAAAGDVLVPTLVFAGAEDCVTPIVTNQQPMYDGLSVSCKALVTASGGGHCYFADENFLCDFGESTCGPNLSISRAEQQDIVLDIGTMWLDVWLQGQTGLLGTFTDSLTSSARISAQLQCVSTALSGTEEPACTIAWLDGSNLLSVTCGGDARIIGVVDALGRRCPVSTVGSDPHLIDASRLVNGWHMLLIEARDGQRQQTAFVVIR